MSIGAIVPKHIPSAINASNILTKPLTKPGAHTRECALTMLGPKLGHAMRNQTVQSAVPWSMGTLDQEEAGKQGVAANTAAEPDREDACAAEPSCASCTRCVSCACSSRRLSYDWMRSTRSSSRLRSFPAAVA